VKQKNSIWGLLKRTVAQWIEDQPFLLSSSLSYYTLFSLAPLLIIVIAIAGFAFGREAAEQENSWNNPGNGRATECSSYSRDDPKRQ
jgi:uncharacterized BrkB/YihY/UPF0761 family membrane protein